MPTQAVVYPPENKPYWATPGIEEEYRRLQTTGVLLYPHSKYPVKVALTQLQFVNDTARDIYFFVDGKRTGKEVYESLVNKNGVPNGTHQEVFYKFVQKMVSLKHISLSGSPSEKGYTLSGSEEYFIPVHASLEVTAQCNARCKHCYGDFSTPRNKVMATKDVLDLLDELWSAGVHTIELTGGECTTHPDFPVILDKCVNTFNLVAVLTNGISVSNEVFGIAKSHPWNLVVQICINGKKEFHDDFVAFSGAFDHASNSIKKFAECGIIVGAPMNLMYDNWMDMEYVCDHVIAMGASQFSASWVDTTQGRAMNLNTCRTNDICPIAEASQMMITLEEKYPGFAVFSLPSEMQNYDKSCGVGRRTIYVTSDSVVHLCPMSIGTDIPGFGAVQSYIRSETHWDNSFSRLIQQVNEPNDNDCGHCQHRSACTCIARGIRQYLKTPKDCTWGQRYKLDQLLESADWTGV